MVKIFVSDPIDDGGLGVLKQNKNMDVVKKVRLSEDDIIKEASDASCLLVRSETKVTQKIIESMSKLKLIGRAGVGVDNIDRVSASKKGVVVMNVPGGNTISAAEHAIGLLLALSRNIPQANASLKDKKWDRKKFVGTELYGKTLGLIGLGRIGKEVAKRMLSFGMEVVAYDPFVSEDSIKNMGVRLATLDELLAQSDFISLHAPKNENTKGMINKETIAKMKQGVRIINCSRGEVINEADFVQAVSEGRIKGAALDVFSKEPAVDLPVIEPESIIVTPHLGASTEEAQIKVAEELSQAVIDFFDKGIIRNAVNMPSVDAETYRKLEPYINLCVRMGKLVAQVSSGGIKKINVSYSGEMSQYDVSTLTLAFIQGVLSPILDVDVNLVNAKFLAQERGISINEAKVPHSDDFTSLLSVELETDKDKNVISGTIFSSKYPKIVSINSIAVDVAPQGSMIILINKDKPGVVGYLGTLLGKKNINIGGMQVGRGEKDGYATTIINVDSPLSKELLDEIGSSADIKKIFGIKLD